MRKLLLLSLLLLALPAAADDLRQRAMHLVEGNQFAQALPLLEQLAARNPEDGEVMLKLGFCRLLGANGLTDPEARQRERERARQALEAARRLGVRDSMLTAALASLDEPDARLSENEAADRVMRQAEQAFQEARYPDARGLYQKALELDPTLYDAALYAGQCYSLEGDAARAADWYGRAVALDPGREAAYRYWGNLLLRSGQAEPALAKYLLGYLSEPYARFSRSGLVEYARARSLRLAHPPVVIPARVEGDKVEISPDAGAAWLAYGLQHALWQREKWAERHPEQAYRASLEEEADCIRTALRVAGESGSPLDESLRALHGLDRAGLLEAYILLGRADKGIVEDYPAYRRSHPDLLERYVREVVLRGGAVGP